MKKENIYKFLLIGLFALISIAVPVATIISSAQLPENAFSENENRYLEKMPKFNFDTVTDKTFMTKFENYFSDRIVMREQWISLMNDFDRLLGKKEIKGIFTEDGRMMQSWRESDYDKESVSKNLAAMESFAQKYPKIKMYFMLAPNAQEIYSDTLPANCGAADQKLFIKDCYDSVPTIKGIDIYSALSSAKNDYIYYRTDHHWTSLGAYYAYSQLCQTLGLTPFDTAAHTAQPADNLYGTHYAKARTWNAVPDVITYYDLANTLTVWNVTAAGQPTEGQTTGLYDTEKLSVYDKYAMFLHGNNGLSRVQGNGSGRILVIKDSYANCFVPYLTANYADIDVVDFRNYNYGLDKLIADNGYDQILVLYNFDSFKSDPYLYRAGVQG